MVSNTHDFALGNVLQFSEHFGVIMSELGKFFDLSILVGPKEARHNLLVLCEWHLRHQGFISTTSIGSCGSLIGLLSGRVPRTLLKTIVVNIQRLLTVEHVFSGNRRHPAIALEITQLWDEVLAHYCRGIKLNFVRQFVFQGWYLCNIMWCISFMS